MHVSRAVLREAFHLLEAKGLVVSIQGDGRYLRSIPSSTPNPEVLTLQLEKISLIEIYETRLALEPMAAKLAAARANNEDLEHLAQVHASLQGKERGDEEDFAFHLAVAETSKNYLLTKLIATQLNLVANFSDDVFRPLLSAHKMSDYLQDHASILQALREQDGIRASHLMEEHISSSLRLLLSR
ncbi:MAG: FadR family transcriptional regulator [Firmicutes bacterium]|nr:FadR family transcriptional regulator [Bacillota bacterium]